MCELDITDSGTIEGYTDFRLHSGDQQGKAALKEAERIAGIIERYLGEEERYRRFYCKKADEEDIKAKQKIFLERKKRVRLRVENNEQFDGGVR